MQLKDLKTDIRNLSDEDLMARIKDIKNRRVEAPEKVKTREKKKVKSTQSKLADLLGISADELTSLLGD